MESRIRQKFSTLFNKNWWITRKFSKVQRRSSAIIIQIHLFNTQFICADSTDSIDPTVWLFPMQFNAMQSIAITFFDRGVLVGISVSVRACARMIWSYRIDILPNFSIQSAGSFQERANFSNGLLYDFLLLFPRSLNNFFSLYLS